MSTTWQSVADCLRAELEEYGILIRLHEEQQGFLFKRDGASVLRMTKTIDEQTEILMETRKRRLAAAVALIRSTTEGEPTLDSVISRVSPDARPLLKALAADVSRAAARLRRVSRHNRLFLIRTIENYQELLRRLRPGSFTKVYSPNGSIALAPSYREAAFAAEG
jgi:flagellar biosynthesis/type III secretory pathway chaperone